MTRQADLVWDGCCCALLHWIYRSFPPIQARLCLCSPPLHPLPFVTSHAHLHMDSANSLIFLEQWCQLFIPPSLPLFYLSDWDWFSPSPLPSICPCSLGHEVTLARNTADILHVHSPGNAPVWCVCACVCVFVRVCLRNSCQSISLLCSECQEL